MFVQQLVEYFVVIVHAAYLNVPKTFRHRLQELQPIDGVIDGGILRHALDDVNDFLFCR
jgi:hypothetical protein